MIIHRPQHDTRGVTRSGFTLVEMMVAMALVLLMMTMFAEIFTLATSSMSRQKSIAELDQRQRTASTILRNDIQDRTFLRVVAWHLDDVDIPPSDPRYIEGSDRRGYFYISENDPDDDTDDVLQFTIERRRGKLVFGRSKELTANGVGVGSPLFVSNSNPNQPEYDDVAINGAGSSPYAEVAYFVRNGTLYRRILLVRLPQVGGEQPFSNPPPPPPPPPAPMGWPFPARLLRPGVYPGSPSYVTNGTTFPNDFDYSATYDFGAKQIEILGFSRLANDSSSFDPFSLGLTRNRFGFNPLSGRPLEFLSSSLVGDPEGFLGRFTHEETSHAAFGWPGDPGPNDGPDNTFFTMDDTFGSAADTNPFTRTNLRLTPTGVVVVSPGMLPVYQSGPRQGEDILLTNVVGFDIKVWDPAGGPGLDGLPGIGAPSGPISANDDGDGSTNEPLGELGAPNSDDGDWVDIGNNGLYGFYSQSNNWNSNFGPKSGPLAVNNRCFDTWQPNQPGIAPFLFNAGVDGQPGVAAVDDDGDGTTDNVTELGTAGSDDFKIPPMKAIQIRVKYRDISNNIIREVTIVEQLTDRVNDK